MEEFRFRWTTAYRLLAAPFLIAPRTASVRAEAAELTVRFGPWAMRTPIDNVVGSEITSGYSLIETAGPPHLSLADRGVTFATNGDRGLCIRFAFAVPGIDPLRRIRHPAATVTVEDIAGLQRLLAR